MSYLPEMVASLMGELIEMQKEKLLRVGREFIPNLTSEDVLQPNDYPELEANPYFRHEEGILEGLQTARSALLSLIKENMSA